VRAADVHGPGRERDRVNVTAHDRRRIRAYTIGHWWYSRGPWTHITVLTVLFLGFCAAVAYATYPLLERAVTT